MDPKLSAMIALPCTPLYPFDAVDQQGCPWLMQADGRVSSRSWAGYTASPRCSTHRDEFSFSTGDSPGKWCYAAGQWQSMSTEVPCNAGNMAARHPFEAGCPCMAAINFEPVALRGARPAQLAGFAVSSCIDRWSCA